MPAHIPDNVTDPHLRDYYRYTGELHDWYMGDDPALYVERARMALDMHRYMAGEVERWLESHEQVDVQAVSTRARE